MVITHYQRLPTMSFLTVSTLYDGQPFIQRSRSLALELEEKGYEWLIGGQSND